MNLKNTAFLPLCISFFLLVSGCASLTGFETGRTSGKDGGTFSASINATKTPDFDVPATDSTTIRSFFFPNVEASIKYGVLEKLDIGLKANTNLNFLLDAKYQILGDQNSPAAVSVGLGIGSFGPPPSPLWNVQIPVYVSMHPSENLAIYVIPRYTYQFVVGDISGVGHLGYTGGNVGVLFGKDFRIGLDAGLYNVSAGNIARKVDLQTYVSFGIGLQMPF